MTRFKIRTKLKAAKRRRDRREAQFKEQRLKVSEYLRNCGYMVVEFDVDPGDFMPDSKVASLNNGD
jgi:hypothetical protein